MNYGQIDTNNICVVVSDFGLQAVDPPQEHMIPLNYERGEEVIGWTWNGSTWIAPTPIDPPPLTRVSRFTVVNRLTDAEGDLLLAAFNEAPGKLRFLWDAVQYIDHADANYQTLHDFIASVVGVARADAILLAVA